MEEYLTAYELSLRIKFSRQTLYNLIHKGTFILGIHYLKPTKKKVLFKWTEIRTWLGDASTSKQDNISESAISETESEQASPADNIRIKGRINI